MAEELLSLLEFSQILHQLKYTVRYKNTRCTVRDSTAAHSYGVAAMAHMYYVALGLDIDLKKALQLALVHDLAEALTDDIDASLVADGLYSRDKKIEDERLAIQEMTECLPLSLRNNIHTLWEEYCAGASEEAKYIIALDKLESLLNSYTLGNEKFDHTNILVTRADKPVEAFPPLKPVLGLLKHKMRSRFEELGIPWTNEYNYGLSE